MEDGNDTQARKVGVNVTIGAGARSSQQHESSNAAWEPFNKDAREGVVGMSSGAINQAPDRGERGRTNAREGEDGVDEQLLELLLVLLAFELGQRGLLLLCG